MLKTSRLLAKLYSVSWYLGHSAGGQIWSMCGPMRNLWSCAIWWTGRNLGGNSITPIIVCSDILPFDPLPSPASPPPPTHGRRGETRCLLVCQTCLTSPRIGELPTKQFKSHLMRTQSLKVLPLKPRVGQYIAMHDTLTARDFLDNFYPSGSFTCIFSQTSPEFFFFFFFQF